MHELRVDSEECSGTSFAEVNAGSNRLSGWSFIIIPSFPYLVCLIIPCCYGREAVLQNL